MGKIESMKEQLEVLNLHAQLRQMIREIDSLADKEACEYQGMLINCLKEVESALEGKRRWKDA